MARETAQRCEWFRDPHRRTSIPVRGVRPWDRGGCCWNLRVSPALHPHPEVRSDEATRSARRHPPVPRPARRRRGASPARSDSVSRVRRLCSRDRHATDQAALGSACHPRSVDRELERRHRSGSDRPGR
jgi:hypothetical protein